MSKRRRLTRPKPGIYEGIPFVEYQAWPYVNSSVLGYALRSAAHYQWSLEQPPRPTTDELRFGTLVHCMLSGDQAGTAVIDQATWQDLVNRYSVPTRTREWDYRVAKMRSAAKNPRLEIHTPEEWARAEAAIDAVRASQRAAEYLRVCRYELSIVWNDDVTGLRCKARLDAVNGAGIVDLKTTRDAAVFEQAIRTYHYHRQLAFYQHGWAVLNGGELLEPRLIAVESHPFHGVRAAPLSDAAIEVGREEYQVALERIARGTGSGDWPGYSHPAVWDVAIKDTVTVWVEGEERTW